MAEWQKKYVNKNRSRLYSATKCDHLLIDKLVESQVFSEMDASSLMGLTCTPYERSSELYSMLLNRKLGGYEALIKVLYECGQTEAAGILLNGMRSRRGPCQDAVYNPFVQCGMKIDKEAISKIKVSLRGKKTKITDILWHVDPENLLDVFDTNDLKYELLDLLMSPQKEMELLRNEIPIKPAFYVERSISNRLKLQPQIFKEEINDVFLFKGITEMELFQLADNREIISLTEKMKNKHNDARFVFVDDEKDWKQIRERISSPVHVVSVELIPIRFLGYGEKHLKEYILERFSPDSKDIWKWVRNPSKSGKSYISENEFVEIVATRQRKSGYCICDIPGMGKSFLLAEICRKISKDHPNRLVLFIDLFQFTKTCEKNEISLRYFQDNPLEVLMKYVSSSKFGEAILLYAVKKGKMELELFFDGLDEVYFNDLETTKKFLKRILDVNKLTNVYVASRGNLRKELEQTIEAIAYDIMPFTPDNQVEFLKEYWKVKADEDLDDERLKDMANMCLDNLYETTDSEGMMGIPLKCYFLADVYLEQAVTYSRASSKEKSPTILQMSHFKLYEKFIDQRLTQAVVQSACRGLTYSEHFLRTFHTLKALELICPEIAPEYARFQGLDKKDLLDRDFYFVGILVGSTYSDDDRFIHYSVAEYFVAEFTGNHFQAGYCAEKKFSPDVLSTDKLYKKIFSVYHHYREKPFELDNEYTHALHYDEYSFSHPLIVCFINCRFEELDLVHSVCYNFHVFLELLMQSFFKFLNACVVNNLDHLLRVVITILKSSNTDSLLSLKQVLLHEVDMYDENFKYPEEDSYTAPAVIILVLRAALGGNSESIKQCIQLLELCNLKIENVYIKHVVLTDEAEQCKYTILHAAVDSCNFYVFSFIWQRFQLNVHPMKLLQWCATSSLRRNGVRLETTLKICKFLLSEACKLLKCSKLSVSHVECTKLYEEGVHPQVLEFLWENVENAWLAHTQGKNVVHFAVHSMTNLFNDLFKLVLSKPGGISLFQSKPFSWKNPIPDILINIRSEFLDTELFLRILKESKLDLQKKPEMGDGFFNNFGDHLYFEENILRADFKDKKDTLKVTYADCLILLVVKHNHSLELYKNLVELGATDIFRANAGKCFVTFLSRAHLVNEKLWDYYLNECVLPEKRLHTLNSLLKYSSSDCIRKYLQSRGAEDKGIICHGPYKPWKRYYYADLTPIHNYQTKSEIFEENLGRAQYSIGFMITVENPWWPQTIPNCPKNT